MVVDRKDWFHYISHNLSKVWAFSSAGRALPLQGRCRRFDPVNAHHFQPSQLFRQISQFAVTHSRRKCAVYIFDEEQVFRITLVFLRRSMGRFDEKLTCLREKGRRYPVNDNSFILPETIFRNELINFFSCNLFRNILNRDLRKPFSE